MHFRVIINAPPVDPLPSGAVVRVYVEDTSRIDAAARPVADSTVRIDTPTRRIPVEITCREPLGNESFTARVHVDVDGSGQVTVGDLVSTATHQVVEGDMEVSVQRVG